MPVASAGAVNLTGGPLEQSLFMSQRCYRQSVLPSSDAGKWAQVGSRLLLSKKPKLCVLLALCLLPANFLPVAVGICPACMCLEPLALERFWGLQE